MINCHKCHGSIEKVRKRLELISSKIDTIQRADPEHTIYDTEQFMQIMNISKRTVQKWRQDGLISYSQVGQKFYYKLSDILQVLEKYYKPSKDEI